MLRYLFSEAAPGADVLICLRYPDSVLGAVIDRLEYLYLMGLPILQLFVSFYGGLPSPESDEITSAATFVRAKAVVVDIIGAASIAAVSEGCTPPDGILTTLADAASCASPTSTLSAALETVTGIAVEIVSAEARDAPISASSSTMEFLPLMLTSVYCAIGLLWAFGRLSWIYMARTPSK